MGSIMDHLANRNRQEIQYEIAKITEGIWGSLLLEMDINVTEDQLLRDPATKAPVAAAIEGLAILLCAVTSDLVPAFDSEVVPDANIVLDNSDFQMATALLGSIESVTLSDAKICLAGWAIRNVIDQHRIIRAYFHESHDRVAIWRNIGQQLNESVFDRS